jgi:hypothetical protein
MIDIVAILDELGVDYKASGKNVGPNDVNIDCVFCGADKHLGINVSNGFVFCWVCEFNDLPIKPSLLKVLHEATVLSWSEIKEVLAEHGWEQYSYAIKKSDSGLAERCSLPIESKKLSDIHKSSKGYSDAIDYLSRRGFGKDIIGQYGLRFASSGNYGGRIIIPICLNFKIVSFTSRDYTGKQKNRYKHAPLYMSAKRIKDLLYNYDRAKDHKHIYVLEGPTDVWRMGEDSVAVFRSALSAEQRNLLISLKPKSVTIIFDPMATSRAYDAAESLLPFINKIKVARLTGEKDVANMTRDEVLKIENRTRTYRG